MDLYGRGRRDSDVWTGGTGTFRTGLGSRLAMEFWTNCVWKLDRVSL